MLIVAAGIGHLEMVLRLLNVHHVTPDFKDKDRRTALSWAAGNGHSDIVGHLLRRTDVDPNSRDCNAYTPLHYALEKKHTRTVELLRQHGAVEESNPGNTSEMLRMLDDNDCEDMWETLFTANSRHGFYERDGLVQV
jgi:ankyrin repeat protein